MLALEEVNTDTRTTIIIEWYETVFPAAAAYIRKRGGDFEEAKEIFQEAIVLYYEKISGGDFILEGNDQSYLMGMVKKLWLKRRERSHRYESLEHVDLTEEKEKRPMVKKLLHHLERAGERCMNLLQAFYYEKLSMQQISERFGYASERSATVQKFKCLEKVRDDVKQKSLSYEDFLD